MIERFEFTPTKDDFDTSGWKEAVEQAQPKVVNFYSSVLGRKADAEDDARKSGVLRLLAAVSFSHITDDAQNPIPTVDRFSEDDLTFFAEIAEHVDDFELQSRIADLLWVRKRHSRWAELAVDSYLQAAAAVEAVDGGLWTRAKAERALYIAAAALKRTPHLQQTVDYITGLLDRLGAGNESYLPAELMEVLIARRLGDTARYAALSEQLAESAEARNEFDKARRYWDAQVSWCFISGDQTAARAARLKIAENYEKEAAFHQQNHSVPNTMAAYSLEQAISAYREAGNSAAKVEELRFKIRDLQRDAMREMPAITVPAPDISEIVDNTIQRIGGKTLEQALVSLATAHSSNKVSALEQTARENREKYVFGRMFPIVLHASDGRIEAREPKDETEAVRASMFQNAELTRAVCVNGIIEPARTTILNQHYVRTQNFLPFLIDNPLVKPGREYIVAQGLLAGLNYDYVAATHLLIPQIEESLRYVLIRFQIATASFSDDGIQSELNLNQFLKEEKYSAKLIEVFGEDFIFDLRGLLVERFGANLRNDMAHGLIDYHLFYSNATTYLWWLALRFYLVLPICILEIDAVQENR